MLKRFFLNLIGRSKDAGSLTLDAHRKAMCSYIQIDSQDERHELLLGQVRYGKGHEPVDGHKPTTVIECVDDRR